MAKIRHRDGERGQVAIITVMFFMILFSVLVLGFARVVVSEQRQTTNNELAASAMAAAEAGVEDAKRIIEYCQDKAGSDECAGVYKMNNSDCNSIIGSSTLMDALDISTIDEGSSKQAVVASSDEAGYEQYYTCMIVNYNSPEYIGTTSSSGTSSVVPLKVVNGEGNSENAAYFTFSWHNSSDSVDKAVSFTDVNSNFPAASVWLSSLNNRPAAIRLEIVAVPKSGGFTVTSLANNSRAVTLRPISSGTQSGGQLIGTTAGGGKVAYNMDYWQQSTEPNSANQPLQQVVCNSISTYACQISFTLTGGSFNMVNNDYYLRVQSIYKGTEFQVVANSADTVDSPLYFAGIQATVDVTGRANDAYKRLFSRLEPTGASDTDWWAEYALQSGGSICKQITIGANSGSDDCVY